MVDSTESKLDAIINALNFLSVRTTELEGIFSKLQSDTKPSMIPPVVQSLPQVSASKDMVAPMFQQDSPPIQQRKEPRVSLPEKFDGTRSNFRGFVNQIRLITFLQPERYPIDESRVGLVGTLLIGQALSWFAPLFKKS